MANGRAAVDDAWLTRGPLIEWQEGSADLHLPLGCGNVEAPRAIAALKACKYDGTITLEAFTPDRELLRYSRDVLRRMWDASP